MAKGSPATIFKSKGSASSSFKVGLFDPVEFTFVVIEKKFLIRILSFVALVSTSASLTWVLQVLHRYNVQLYRLHTTNIFSLDYSER